MGTEISDYKTEFKCTKGISVKCDMLHHSSVGGLSRGIPAKVEVILTVVNLKSKCYLQLLKFNILAYNR